MTITQQRNEKKAVKQDEAAAILGVDPKTIYNWRAKNIIQGTKVGGVVLIPMTEIDRILTGGEQRNG